jgi:hypothetical protein
MSGIYTPTTPGLAPTGNVYNDTTSVYGSPLVVIGSGTYDTTDFNVECPSTKKVQKNSSGVPVRQFALPEVANGTANLIMASNSTTIPAPGVTLTTTQTGTQAWFLDKVSLPYKQEDFFVVPIAFSQKLN